jgi:sister-chromatid-cohesion protein PDS5
VEEDEEQGSLKKLKFKQPLVGRPGKQISVGELLARLTKLCEELRSLEQEEADRETLEPVAKELAHHSLVQHKDAGVRAWTACCIVDMFRLCAPDAPYTAAQLKDIFTLIVVKIFPALADPSNPYNAQHLYVLKCLAEVKSIVLLTDIPGSGQLTTTLFRNCFDVLSGPSKAANGEELSKNVEHHMTAVLAILVDEAPSLSSEVVDVIVAQFLWADPISLGATKGKKVTPVDAKQSTLLRKEAPPAYNMAKNVCKQCPDKMARYIGSYFSSVIVDFTSIGVGSTKSRHGAGGDQDEADDEHTKGPSEDDLNDASKAHRLLRELWRCAPGVLQDIIPHLQEELGTDNIQLRQLATETFGDMISGIGAAGPPPRPEMNPAAYPSQSLTPSEPRPYNFLTTPTSPNSFPSLYPAAYHAFLQRRHDKSPIIRAAWTTGVGRILMTSAGGVGLDSDEEQKLLKHFAETLIDSDERVRLAAVRAVDHFDFDSIVQKLGRDGSMSDSGSILANLAARVKDRKSILQSESMKLLGKIWGVAAGAITEGNERITTLLGPIPSRILEACYVNDPELNVRVDLTLFDSLLPLGYPPMKPRATTNGGSQVVKDSQTTAEQGYTEAELDKIRVERQLLLVKGLEEKAKKVFFAKQANQANGAKFMEHFLKLCEEYNGGVMDKGAKDTKTKLEGLIAYYAKTLPEPARVISDLWKFAEAHDRRNYQLIRFCMAPESEYRKVYRSIVSETAL